MDELGKSIPIAEGMVDAEQLRGAKNFHTHCLNCGTALKDVFCHSCGQKDIPRRQTLGELFSNFISSFWSYEGKFFRTTLYLLTKPGFLASEYNAGKRESYYHPARMYVFISFIFFLLAFSLPSTNEDGEVDLSDEDKSEMIQNLTQDLQETNNDISQNPYYNDSTWKKFVPSPDSSKKKKSNLGYRLTSSDYQTVEAYDSAENAKPENERDGWFLRKIKIKGIELNKKYAEGGDFGNDFGQAFKDNFSKVLFYLLPFFALLLKLLYVRRDFFYSEHLVFSIYYYNFFYLAGSLFMLAGIVPFVSDYTFIIAFWIYFYLLFALKRTYQQSWRKTIFKFFLFSVMFSVLMSLGIGIAALSILMAM